MTDFGVTPDGASVERIVLGREPGPVLHLLTLGATVHRLEVTCGDGVRRNVALGHASVEEYLASSDYIGAVVGRYANRIAAGRFELDGTSHQLGTHDRGNHLHGGPDGFDRRVWEVVEATDDRAVLELVSPDGDQGFPGQLTARASYAVTNDGVRIELSAVADAPTLANLTSHAYLNLDGDGAGTIDHHRLTVDADEFTPVDDSGIPLGTHAAVAGTPFDLRGPRLLGEVVREPHEQLVAAGGIDHNFVVRGSGLRTHAVLESPGTRTRLEVRSDQPGLQVYTGNFLDGTRRSSTGRAYRQGDGIALEPQLFPDSPNRPEWPSAVLRPRETYRHTIEWVVGAVAG
jgi:aldose 1-epimerase